MESARLFVAITPPAAVRAEIAALSSALTGVRWIPAENLHLTLRFIGETAADKQPAFETALERVRVQQFILPVAGVGVFPTRGPAKVLWAGLGNAHPRLFQLRQQVDEALLSVDVALDVRSFHPHFTFGRIGVNHDPKALAKFTAQHAAFEAPPFRVREFQLMASEEGPAGQAPTYRVVRSYPLLD